MAKVLDPSWRALNIATATSLGESSWSAELEMKAETGHTMWGTLARVGRLTHVKQAEKVEMAVVELHVSHPNRKKNKLAKQYWKPANKMRAGPATAWKPGIFSSAICTMPGVL